MKSRWPSDGTLAIGALIAFALWIFVALPLYYGPRDANSATQKCPSRENENYAFWEKTRCDPITYFTLWLVGFTGVLAGVSIFQGVILLRADRTNRIAAEAAKLNAEAAKKSAEVAERAFSHSRQPDFGFQRKKLENTGVGQFPSLQIIFRNIGRGDAFSVKIVSSFEVLPIGRLETPFKTAFEGFGTTIVIPGGTIERKVLAKHPLTDEDIKNIRAEKAAICLWGYIVYQNIDDQRCSNTFSYVCTGKSFDSSPPVFGKGQIEIQWPEPDQNSEDQHKVDGL
jgi:hypothetical protein